MNTLLTLREKIKSCTACDLRKQCKAPVPFAGNLGSKILFVGRDPGEEEDITGFPFVGRSGKLLREICLEAGFDPWKDCLIFNTILCRPQGNKEQPVETYRFCSSKWLLPVIRAIQPRAIVMFGNIPRSILLPDIPLKHGERLGEQRMVWHPSYWLRSGGEAFAQKKVLPVFQNMVEHWNREGIFVRQHPDYLILPEGVR